MMMQHRDKTEASTSATILHQATLPMAVNLATESKEEATRDIVGESDSNSNSDDGGGRRKETATYWKLLRDYRAFRLYLCSYITALIGEWLTYIASITLLANIQQQQSSVDGVTIDSSGQSKTAVSILIVVTLLPCILLAPFAGAWADTCDRRVAMIVLELVGAIIPLFYLLAMQQQSIFLLYVITFLKYSVAGMYEPNMWAMLPLLVTDDDYLQKATTLTEMMWSVIYTLASAAGGLVLGCFGFRICFFLDSLSYLVSAYLLWSIGGTWKAPSDVDELKQQQNESPWATFKRMTVDGIAFLRSDSCGAFVLMKTSGAIIYGACDIIAVAFSEADYSSNNTGVLHVVTFGSHSSNAVRLGYLFASSGVGCIVGPLVSESYTRMDIPSSHQKACILGLGVAAFSCVAMSVPSLSFFFVCLFTAIRSAGDNITSIDSSLLVQKYSPPDMLGRVTSVESALVYLSEGLMTCFCGILMDRFRLDAHGASFVMGSIGSIIFVGWVLFHLLRRGANRPLKDQSVVACQLPTEETSLLP